MAEELVKRSGKVAFYGVPSAESGEPTYYRMRGFTDMSQSKNPAEYNRRYVDEDFEQTDVTGYSPSIAYTFDMHKGNAALEDLVTIIDNELTGSDAVRDIVIVDIATKKAVKRSFAVVPDTEGDSTDAYTYSGNFKVKGTKIFGVAATKDEWKQCTFTEDTVVASSLIIPE